MKKLHNLFVCGLGDFFYWLLSSVVYLISIFIIPFFQIVNSKVVKLKQDYLREAILKEHSKAQCDVIVAWVGDNQRRFDQLFQLFLEDADPMVQQRAGWPLGYCVERRPGFMDQRLGRLLNNLEQTGLHDAVRRNTVRILQTINIPEEHQGLVMDTCFTMVNSMEEKVAVKACAISVLANLAKAYPEIIPEIKLVISNQLPHQTAGFKSRAKQVLALLKVK